VFDASVLSLPFESSGFAVVVEWPAEGILIVS
jgi:hypothetical protein